MQEPDRASEADMPEESEQDDEALATDTGHESVAELLAHVRKLLRDAMAQAGVSVEELASRIEGDPVEVARVLSDEGGDLYIGTLALLAYGLGMHFEMELVPSVEPTATP